MSTTENPIPQQELQRQPIDGSKSNDNDISKMVSLAQRLNYSSGYLVDWLRVGELLRSGKHRYTFAEMVPRVFVALCTIGPVIFHRSVKIRAMIQCLIAFVISHTIVIYPLILKRHDTQIQCNTLVKTIKEKDCKCNNSNKENNKIECDTCDSIKDIMNSVAKNGRASETWGMRRRKLQKLLETEAKE